MENNGNIFFKNDTEQIIKSTTDHYPYFRIHGAMEPSKGRAIVNLWFIHYGYLMQEQLCGKNTGEVGAKSILVFP